MKLTVVLLRQHIGRMTRRHWYANGHRQFVEKSKEEVLIPRGISIVDPKDVLDTTQGKLLFKFDDSHTKNKSNELEDNLENITLAYSENDYLVEGVTQAQIITNTVTFENIPHTVNNLANCSAEINNIAKKLTESSCIYNSHQEVLPKLTDPERIFYNFPRQYGITKVRKVNNLYNMFLQLCESIGGPTISKENTIIRNCRESLLMKKEDSEVCLSLPVDVMIVSKTPIKPISLLDEHDNLDLPNLYPLEWTIGLKKENTNGLLINPILKYHSNINIHTIFSHFDSEDLLRNKSMEMPINETQFLAQAILKSFIAASTCARQKYGTTVKDLPQPICVQCVQSDGKSFHFSVYQLNTLDLNSNSNKRNFWWSDPKMDLYSECGYENGIPILLNYNNKVFEKILAFYMNR